MELDRKKIENLRRQLEADYLDHARAEITSGNFDRAERLLAVFQFFRPFHDDSQKLLTLLRDLETRDLLGSLFPQEDSQLPKVIRRVDPSDFKVTIKLYHLSVQLLLPRRKVR